LYPSYVPPAPRRSSRLGLKIALGLLVIAALLCGATDGALFLAGRVGTDAAFVDGDRPLTELLTRRAAAVAKHDQAAFLADVDTADPRFVDRQRTEYQNLVALGLSSFTLELTSHTYEVSDADLIRRYGGALREVGVTVRYAIAGLDTVPDAEPWIPTLALMHGRWLLVSEEGAGSGTKFPFGVGGQPWEARPIVVVKSAHVVAVVSKEDQEIAPHLLDLAERGVVNAAKVRPEGWPDKVLMTAVSDQKVFDSYFAGSPDKLAQVEAVTVPRYSDVAEWNSGARFALSRVVFNPNTLGRGDEELQHTLTHEFTHVAFGPETTDATPVWLIEGTAEYVAFASEKVSDAFVTQAANHVSGSTLPADRSFYDSADNYLLGWLACKLIAQKYGQAKLIALYDWFQDHSDEDGGFRAALGISYSAFLGTWQNYLKTVRGG
jgi:Peptidase MA superfamily